MNSKLNDEVYSKNFKTLKSQQCFVEDASRKSSIDIHIKPLVEAINNSENYFTTSSCSGRFLAFVQDEVYIKKNCEWIKVTHDPLKPEDVEEFINCIEKNKTNVGQILLKFEPFILHVCCRTLNHAKLMLEQCIASGYRNSGISLGSAKIILAVRSTQNLECPVTFNKKLLVDHDYIKHICNLVNEKFKENFERIDRFFKNIEPNCLNCEIVQSKTSKKDQKALERLEKKKMFDDLKKSGELRDSSLCKNKIENEDSESEISIDDIDNLFIN